MDLCPFLTTSKERVYCFGECCFYKEASKCIFVIYDEKKDCVINEPDYEEKIYKENMSSANILGDDSNEDNIQGKSLSSYTYLDV